MPLGLFDSIGNLSCNNIAKFDGTNWSSFPYLAADGWQIGDAIFYKDYLYVGGNFSAGAGLNDIARFNFSTDQWETVGGGTSCDCWINKFYIFHDTLIVEGYFQSLNGQPFNNIASWDGDNWIDMNGGLMPSNVWDVVEYNNYLYACGQISYLPDNTPIKRVARWDGQQWTDAGFNFASVGTPMCLETLKNNLYIAGGFTTFNGDTVNSIVQYNAPTGLNETYSSDNIFFYPNPFSGSFTVFTNELAEISVYNIYGQVVKKEAIKENTEINLTSHPSGLYLLIVDIAGEIKNFKAVKL